MNYESGPGVVLFFCWFSLLLSTILRYVLFSRKTYFFSSLQLLQSFVDLLIEKRYWHLFLKIIAGKQKLRSWMNELLKNFFFIIQVSPTSLGRSTIDFLLKRTDGHSIVRLSRVFWFPVFTVILLFLTFTIIIIDFLQKRMDELTIVRSLRCFRSSEACGTYLYRCFMLSDASFNLNLRLVRILHSRSHFSRIYS